MMNLLGIVLCGGQSKRMGTDKGLISEKGKIWSQLMAEKLKSANIPFAISINPSQYDKYAVHFDDKLLVTDDENSRGPLTGLVSTYRKFPLKDILLLACDMIDMDNITLTTLINSYRNNPGYDCYAYHNGKFWEPLCSIYTHQAIKKHIELHLPNTSMQSLLETGRTLKLSITNTNSFNNINAIL